MRSKSPHLRQKAVVKPSTTGFIYELDVKRDTGGNSEMAHYLPASLLQTSATEMVSKSSQMPLPIAPAPTQSKTTRLYNYNNINVKRKKKKGSKIIAYGRAITEPPQ